MKNKLSPIVALLIFSACTLKAESMIVPPADTACLKIQGTAVSNGKPVDGVNAVLYRENDEMEMIEVTHISHHNHDFFFKLNKNSFYTIEVSKPGYIKRMISISTKLPAGVKTEPIFEYLFEIEMHEEKQVSDDYYLDFPIALIDYNEEKDRFVAHGKYTAYIKAKINETLNPESVANKEVKKE